jgi:hypothetical protein
MSLVIRICISLSLTRGRVVSVVQPAMRHVAETLGVQYKCEKDLFGGLIGGWVWDVLSGVLEMAEYERRAWE